MWLKKCRDKDRPRSEAKLLICCRTSAFITADDGASAFRESSARPHGDVVAGAKFRRRPLYISGARVGATLTFPSLDLFSPRRSIRRLLYTQRTTDHFTPTGDRLCLVLRFCHFVHLRGGPAYKSLSCFCLSFLARHRRILYYRVHTTFVIHAFTRSCDVILHMRSLDANINS